MCNVGYMFGNHGMLGLYTLLEEMSLNEDISIILTSLAKVAYNETNLARMNMFV